MKVATEILLPASPEKVWAVLMDFPAYPEWNRFLKAVKGQPAPDATLEVDLQFYGKDMKKVTGKVTALVAPKYFSWIWKHSFGSWFMSSEQIFRLKEKDNDRCVFFHEIFVTGLGLRFRRSDIEHMTKLSMNKLNDDLKDRLG